MVVREMTNSATMNRMTNPLGHQVVKLIPASFTRVIFALLATFASSVAMAAPPATPTGLCIDSSSGTLCAAPPSAGTSNIIAPKSVNPQNFHPGHYMMVGIHDSIPEFGKIINNPNVVGIKKVYTWVDIEPAEGIYDFTEIESDLAYLESIGKRLWIFVLDTTWNSSYNPKTPVYMWSNPKYGCDSRHYGNYERSAQQGGWLPCIWNKNVQSRRAALYQALGKKFNNEPYFEGINLGETSTGVANAAWGYSTESVRTAFMANALALKKAFPDKSVIQYINWAPFDLAPFAAELAQNGIGIGGPDIYLLPEKQSIRDTTYPLQLQYHNDVPITIDAQGAEFMRINSDLGRPNNAAELLQGAIDLINPWYMFWIDIEPYISNDTLPTLDKYGSLPAAKLFYNSLSLQTP